MREKIIKFIEENNLSLFERENVRSSNQSIFKTKDAKEIHQKTLNLVSRNFQLENTKQILKLFEDNNSEKDIEKKQKFFLELNSFENSRFNKLKKRNPSWKAPYDSVVVTEDESTLVKLKEEGCSVVFVNQQSDIFDLDRYDLVRYIDCENFDNLIERIPQAIPISKIQEASLEKNLVELSSWIDNLEILKSSKNTEEINQILEELEPLLEMLEFEEEEVLDVRDIEDLTKEINDKIIAKIREMTLSGESVVSLLTEGIPKEIQDILERELKNSNLPREIFLDTIPIKLDDKEVWNFIKKQSTRNYLDFASNLKKEYDSIKNIPNLLKKLEREIIYQDFISGISIFKTELNFFPKIDPELKINLSKNLFLNNPQPISFELTQNERCSILTGANSGGKTTLLEHLIQLVSLTQLGLPVSGELTIPLFSEIYYFAKNKGSISRGAFETLLTQMSEIKPGERTLILADEIEAVTEPGVAGEIIVSTAEYFIEQNCFLVVATHLGQEVQKLLPPKSRIDGIEATGLTENYELIVNHNPVLGKLANSTPELIIEKMAKAQQKPYLEWLFENLKKRKS